MVSNPYFWGFGPKQSAVREGVKRNATKPKRFDQVIDSLFVLNFALSKLSNVFVGIYTWISLSCYMDLLKLLHRFVNIVTWICQSCSMYFSPKISKFVEVSALN